jgi:hypothetical protein
MRDSRFLKVLLYLNHQVTVQVATRHPLAEQEHHHITSLVSSPKDFRGLAD